MPYASDVLRASVDEGAETADAVVRGLPWRDDTATGWASLRKVCPRDGLPKCVGAFVAAGEGAWTMTSPLPGCTLWAHGRVASRFVRGPLTHALVTAVLCVRRMRGLTAARIIDVWYAEVGGPKRLPQKPGDLVTCEHVNSGATMWRVGDDGLSIVVYRREDACKVMMHEVLHAEGVDEVWRTGSSGGANEAYVDSLACLMHAIWSARCDREPVVGRLARTRSHILDVAARLQNHFEGVAWRESTPAHAYYVGKAAMWFDDAAMRRGMWVRTPTDRRRFEAALRAALSTPAFQAEMQTRRRRVLGNGLQMVPSYVGQVSRSSAPAQKN